jgi:hypothetical protein
MSDTISHKKVGTVRTKHLYARIDHCKGATEENRIRVVFIHTKKIFAFGMMKIFQGRFTFFSR